MDDTPIWTSPWQVYFVLSSKEGDATICVEHPVGHQTLVLPVHPSNAVPEALPLLDPVFAHYVAQWEKIMVPDPLRLTREGSISLRLMCPIASRILTTAQHWPILRRGIFRRS